MRKTFYNGARGPVGARYHRETPQYPSAEITGCNTFKREGQMYSGSYVKGVATMHKSNLVPITNSDAAVDVAKMRRN